MDIFLKTIGSLNDETRLRLVWFIHENDKVCVCDIENSFDMIQSRISRHLKILKEAGFLKVERRGRWAYYAIRSPLDSFRKSILTEISYLDMDIPRLKNSCKTDKLKEKTMKKNVFKTNEGVKINFTGVVQKQQIVKMVENCATGQCECMSDATKKKISNMQVEGKDGNVELKLDGDVSKEEIEKALAKSKVLNK